jgi:very-short-patch-repair endonuclease
MPKPSTLELKFLDYWQLLAPKHLQPIAEYPFAKPRKFRFDYAFPEQRVAIELEGGSWSGGRHTRGQGFEDDCTKYNLAVQLNWRVLRYTTSLLEGDPDGCIRQVVAVIQTNS